jgi:VWFA-related protein
MRNSKNSQGGRIRVSALSVLLLLSSTLFLGQDFQLRTRIDTVVVPISARDKNGGLVTSLTKDDFTILEDGKPQIVTNFSADPQPFSAVFLVDTGLTGAELQRLTTPFIIDKLTHTFESSDEVAIYRYDHVVTKITDFTSSPQVIAKSFGVVKDIADAKPAIPEDTGTSLGPAPLRWLLNRTQIGTNGAPPTAGSSAPTANTTATRPSTVPSKVLHDAVFAATVDLAKRPTERRKIVVLISDGQVVGTNEHTEGETNQRLFKEGIQFYAISSDVKRLEHLTVMNGYAKGTGGEVFDGGSVEAMDKSLAKIVDQARNQYVISYVSSNEATGTRPIMRRIEVKSRDKSLRIVHRQGYLQYP